MAGWELRHPDLMIYAGSARPSRKIAAFDFDGTIVLTKSSATFPKDEKDWRFFNKHVPEKLQQLEAEGYKVVILSNQVGGGGTGSRPGPARCADRHLVRFSGRGQDCSGGEDGEQDPVDHQERDGCRGRPRPAQEDPHQEAQGGRGGRGRGARGGRGAQARPLAAALAGLCGNSGGAEPEARDGSVPPGPCLAPALALPSRPSHPVLPQACGS